MSLQNKQVEKLESLEKAADNFPKDKINVEKLKKAIAEKKRNLLNEKPIEK